MFEILDFDANFKAYCEKWIELNKSKFKTYEEMEDAMPQVYMRWMNSPAAFLNGEAPGNYFQKYDSAPELVKWLRLYDVAGVPTPDQLLDRISDLGKESLKPLMYTAKDTDNSIALRITALNLLKEIDADDAPFEMCLNIIDRRKEDDELADVAGDLLKNICVGHIDEIINRLEDVNGYAKEAYLDILTDYPGQDRVLNALLKEFEIRRDACGLFAGLLGKYGDERALPKLIEALDREEINYLDYIELKDAIDKLGGDIAHERDFTGDIYYEALKREH